MAESAFIVLGRLLSGTGLGGVVERRGPSVVQGSWTVGSSTLFGQTPIASRAQGTPEPGIEQCRGEHGGRATPFEFGHSPTRSLSGAPAASATAEACTEPDSSAGAAEPIPLAKGSAYRTPPPLPCGGGTVLTQERYADPLDRPPRPKRTDGEGEIRIWLRGRQG